MPGKHACMSEPLLGKATRPSGFAQRSRFVRITRHSEKALGSDGAKDQDTAFQEITPCSRGHVNLKGNARLVEVRPCEPHVRFEEVWGGERLARAPDFQNGQSFRLRFRVRCVGVPAVDAAAIGSGLPRRN